MSNAKKRKYFYSTTGVFDEDTPIVDFYGFTMEEVTGKKLTWLKKLALIKLEDGRFLEVSPTHLKSAYDYLMSLSDDLKFEDI